MRLLLLAALLGACASTGSDGGSPGGPIIGTVASVDLSPMAYDGNAVLLVRADDGRTVRVEIPARTNLCAAEGISAVGDLHAGDRVEVVGEAGPEGAVTPCTDAAHRLRVLSRANPAVGTFRGVYESGFETSAFRPCDRPGEVWWLTPDAGFADQFEAIRQREAGAGGRGLRLFVEATVVGDLTDAGQFGHLGAYDHELTVRETRDMVLLGRDLDDVPPCR